MTATAPSDPLVLRSITGFHLVSADPAAMAAFLRDRLGFADEGETAPIPGREMDLLGLAGAGERRTLRINGVKVTIDRFAEPGRPYPPDGNAASPFFQHLALVVADMDAAFARLGPVSVISEGGPQRLPASSGGVRAFKFRSPEGHPLELLEFPGDGTPAYWAERARDGGDPVLGIDHSAVSVVSVDATARFWCDRGLRRDEGSLNRGPEQQRLDGLPDVRVAVAPMSPPDRDTPHLELLGYEHPRPDGPATLRANDVAATRIAWLGGRDMLLRDPDGHLHQVAAGT